MHQDPLHGDAHLEPLTRASLAGELEVLELIGQFFDRAIHSTAEGFQQAMGAERPHDSTPSKPR